jgi:outer membrane protein TolC
VPNNDWKPAADGVSTESGLPRNASHQPAEGTFVDVRSANDLINQTLQANSALVDRVAAGEVSEATLEHRFGYRTGKEAFRPDVDADPYIRSTYGVRIVIRHDPQRKTGYRLLTAYPINKTFLRHFQLGNCACAASWA